MPGLVRERGGPIAMWMVLLALAVLSACLTKAAPGPPLADATLLPAFDPAAIVEGRPSEGPRPPLEVRDYGPEGADEGRIRLRFNQAVVDTAYPERLQPTAALRLTPPVAGKSAWTAPGVLEFEPADELPTGTAFRVVLEGQVHGANGQVVEGIEWTFETERPSFSLYDGDELAPTEPAFLVPELPVEADELAAHLRVRVREGETEGEALPVRVRAATEEELERVTRWSQWLPLSDSDVEGTIELFAIEPQTRWPPGEELSVRVDAALHGSEGPLPMRRPFVGELTTRDVLRVKGIECEPDPRHCEPGLVGLQLSTEVSEEQMQRWVRVTPRPADFQVSEGWSESGSLVYLDGEFEEGRRYRVVVSPRLEDVHGQRLGRRWARTFTSVPYEAEDDDEPSEARATLSSGRATYWRPEDARVGVLTDEVEELRVRVAVLDEADRAAVHAASSLTRLPWPEGGTRTTLLWTLSSRHEQRVLDLSRFGGVGDSILVEVAVVSRRPGTPGEVPVPMRGLFQISGLGAVTHVSPKQGVMRVTTLADAEPRGDVQVIAHTPQGRRDLGRTDSHGLVDLPGASTLVESSVLELRTDGDALVVPLNHYGWERSRRHARMSRFGAVPPEVSDEPPPGLERGETVLAAVATGRGIYLPGDTMHVAGWVGLSTPHRELATRRAPAGSPVVLTLLHRGDVVFSRRVRLSEHGRFSASIPLPPGTRMGRHVLEAEVLGTKASAHMVVAEARIPAFEVDATVSPREVVRGEPSTLTVQSGHLSGDPAPMEALRWVVDCHGTSFHPPGLDDEWDFTSSADTPGHELTRELEPERPRSRIQVTLPTTGVPLRRPHHCGVSVAASDASLQQVGASTGLLVHPASVYLGVMAPRVEEGTPLRIPLIAVSPTGRRVARPGVEVEVWREPDWNDEEPRRRVGSCRVDIPESGEPPACSIPDLVPDHYTVEARTQVGEVLVETDTHAWVIERPDPPPKRRRDGGSTGSDARIEPPSPPPTPFELVLPEQVEAGKPFPLTVRGPWTRASGVLLANHTGLREVRPFEIVDEEASLTLTAKRGRGLAMDVQAVVARPPEDGRLPAVVFAWGHDVGVEESRRLTVEVDAPAFARPRQTVPLAVTVRDDQGRPVDARLTVWVIDEGLHQLREPGRPALAKVFNPIRTGEWMQTSSYTDLRGPFIPGFRRRFGRSPRVRSAKAMVKGAGSEDFGTREEFDSAPLFVGDLGTGPDGHATVDLALADDLTRFRITVIASAEWPDEDGRHSGPARFGHQDRTLQVQVPLPVRAALPRVLRPGDTAEVAALVSLPEQSGTLEVTAVRSDGEAIELTGVTTKRRRHAGEGVARVGFSVRARGVGEPGIELRARWMPDEGDEQRGAVRRTLPVELERTQLDRAALYGSLDQDRPAAIPLILPAGARADHGGLTVSVRSSALGELEDAARYLVEYPYGCLEQTASRLVPLIALGGLKEHLPAGVEDPEAFAADLVARIVSMQGDDGRFSYWPNGRHVLPFAHAYATWVLLEAQRAGFTVPDGPLQAAIRILASEVEQPLPETRWARREALMSHSVAVHALTAAGRTPTGAVDRLFGERDELPAFGRMYLMMAMHRLDPADPRLETLRRRLSASIEEHAGVAHVVGAFGADESTYFASSGRRDALALMTLSMIDPDDPQVEKLAAGVQARRKAGRWRNTQENAHALLALAEYARQRESEPPDHRLDVWVGSRRVMRAEHRAHADSALNAQIPMEELLGLAGDEGRTPVVLDRDGTGRAHYRLELRWAPENAAPPRAQGLSLERTLRDEDGPLDPSEPLIAGNRYAIEVTVETEMTQHFVAIEIPLPAGLEAIDTSLGSGAAARRLDGWPGWWLSHEELRRDRVVLFADSLPPGRHRYTVHVLASTPGRYAMPAAVAEGMYSPEIYGRTAARVVRVDPR